MPSGQGPTRGRPRFVTGVAAVIDRALFALIAASIVGGYYGLASVLSPAPGDYPGAPSGPTSQPVGLLMLGGAVLALIWAIKRLQTLSLTAQIVQCIAGAAIVIAVFAALSSS